MEPADHRLGHDRATLMWLDVTWPGRVFVKRLMRAGRVVVRDEFGEVPFQVGCVRDNCMIEAFAADCADQPSDTRGWPGRMKRDGQIIDAELRGAVAKHTTMRGATSTRQHPIKSSNQLIKLHALKCNLVGS